MLHVLSACNFLQYMQQKFNALLASKWHKYTQLENMQCSTTTALILFGKPVNP